VLGTDLDAELPKTDVATLLRRLDARVQDFKFSGKTPQGRVQIRTSAKLYAAFASGARTIK